MHATTLGQRHEPAAIHSAVVYHKESGDILHIHHLVVFEGADATALVASLERDSIETAKRADCDPSEVATLTLGERTLQPGSEYRVDPGTRTLVQSSGVTRSAIERTRQKPHLR